MTIYIQGGRYETEREFSKINTEIDKTTVNLISNILEV